IQCHAGAQYQLGDLFDKGKGVKQDYTEAAKWIEQATSQGHIKAQYQLAQMHIHGQGVPKDFAEAAQLYRSATNQGHQN
uniref:tetratricopeptide repeat protein n=1 Tax=Lysinibacillus fusiformis TaxID=28031 RepID=UPI0020C16A87